MSSATQIWTVRALLNWTSDYLTKNKIESAQREARILLAHVLNCTPIEVITRFEEEPPDSARTSFRELIRRRVEGWPVAYLVGRKEFYLLTFEVNPAVLIPRPDTETLVQCALEKIRNKPDAKILDLGTGSGCIAISLAHRAKQSRVVAVDISPDAADVARRNAQKLGVGDRVDIRVGDLFAPVKPDEKFDLIVSNPPYLAPGEFAELATDVREHEPRMALDGGPDGLAFYRRISTSAGQYLNSGGWVAVEVGHTQSASVQMLFQETGWQSIQAMKDMNGIERVISVRCK